MILLFDDDCGICTRFTHFFQRIKPKMPVLPMHDERLLAIGFQKIGYEKYWQSFHIVQKGNWTTEGEAITSLASALPMGKVLSYLTTLAPIKMVLLFLLHQMQRVRKLECIH